jgi:preflagellin peptidase FlaK
MLGTVPDLLRLVALPVFGWAAYRDVRTRRVPNRTWYPLVALGVVLLAVEVVGVLPVDGYEERLFLLRTGLSIGFVVPLSYVFWRIGGFGGADAKALMTLAVLLPTYPTYFLPGVGLPVERATLGVFSMTVLTNTVIVGLAYPLFLAVRNAVAGVFSPVAFVGRRVPLEELSTTHGRLFEVPEGFTRRGLDIDALRMYLRWRGLSLAALRANPEACRSPANVGETNHPTDGAVDTDAVDAADWTSVDDVDVDADAERDADAVDDPWAAERFLDEIEGSAYGTTPETLRDGLEVLTEAERDRVWVSPGIPFIVPMFVGLLLAFTYGDVLIGLLGLFGVV